MICIEEIRAAERSLRKLKKDYAIQESRFNIGDYVRAESGYIMIVKDIVYMDNKNGFRLYGYKIDEKTGKEGVKDYLSYYGDEYDNFMILERSCSEKKNYLFNCELAIVDGCIGCGSCIAKTIAKGRTNDIN